MQAESAGLAELRRALDGFLVILAIDPESEEILQVRSEPGGVEIVRRWSILMQRRPFRTGSAAVFRRTGRW